MRCSAARCSPAYGKLGRSLHDRARAREPPALSRLARARRRRPFILLAFAAPWIAPRGERRRMAWWLLAFALLTFACYLPYTVWDAWWFLRFVLPAFPPLLVLSAARGHRGRGAACPRRGGPRRS